eukprot:SAG31_NODE_39036_length_291_cov_1.015625_1_plen_35_part_01
MEALAVLLEKAMKLPKHTCKYRHFCVYRNLLAQQV